jgi:hypothetical protein
MSDYWISKQNCWWNAVYHTKHHKDKKQHKQRAGCVYYNGKCLYGNDTDYNTYEEITVRQFDSRDGHTWTEVGCDHIVDWVINWALKVPSKEKTRWSKAELAELGFEYKPYTNEAGIIKKAHKRFRCGCKDKDRGNLPCPIDWAKNTWCCDL